MLRLVGGPNGQHFIELRSNGASPWAVVWHFIRILRHVRLAVLRAVTTPGVIVF